DRTGGTPHPGVGDEGVAILVRPSDRKERVTRVAGAAVDRHAGDGRVEATTKQGPLGASQQLRERQAWHHGPSAPRRARSATTSLATSRSSNGRTSPAMIWYVSWPFPAITTVSPRRAQSSAWRMASRRSGSRAQPSGGGRVTPAATSSMMAAGSSDRGL